jgi:murein DD-endopeptidase MepM/ murein hydrolase activator NlpD
MHPLLAEVRMHSGVDLAAPLGAPVFATDSGKISSAGWQGGYGIAAVIEHPNGLQTRYGHMSKLNVVAGQQVVKGQIIGFVGSTGLSTGPHLHYEVRFRGQAINPLAMMAPLSVAPKQRKSR